MRNGFINRDTLTLATAFLITLGSGLLYSAIASHRLLPGRSATQEELDRVASTIGPFELERSEPLNETVIKLLQLEAYINRIYTDRGTGQVLHLLLLSGPSVPLTAHTPDVCYATQTYEISGGEDIVEVPIGDSVHTFRLLRLRSRVPAEPGLQVLYGWNAGKTWVSPALAKLRLTGYERLLKLQVALPIRGARELSIEDCHKLMTQVLAALP